MNKIADRFIAIKYVLKHVKTTNLRKVNRNYLILKNPKN